MRRTLMIAVAVGSILAGGVAGAALFNGSGSNAKAAAQTTTTATTGTAPSTPDRHGFGGRHETVSDASVAAKAIGISEADLNAALAKGQTIAQVAKAKGVDPQKVIAALVADGQTELAERVKSGELTQAQAGQEKSRVTQRATDQVNGTFGFGGDGCDGHGDSPSHGDSPGHGDGHGRPNDNDADDQGSTG